MKITPRSEGLQILKPMDSAYFTGEAGSRELIPASSPTTSLFAAVVRFEAGARNHWHSHPGGQLLHVMEGEGWVQVRGQSPQRIRQDDTVTADTGEEHWDGAGSDGTLDNLAMAVRE